MWTCGVCNKTFNLKNYTHQCDIQAMDEIAQVTFHKWIPLYEKIESATKEQLGDFAEIQTESSIVWENEQIFAEIKFNKTTMLIAFLSNKEHPEYYPVEIIKIQENLLLHVIELKDDNNISNIVKWIAESYALKQVVTNV